MFDCAVFGFWPRGIYLADRLSAAGKKTAYIEILPRRPSPLGVFLDEGLQEERAFAESLGFLQRQEGGFCLLSPEGGWPLQAAEVLASQKAAFKKPFAPGPGAAFKDHWLRYLSFNLAAGVFEYNDSLLSGQSLDLFSDYFLFSPDFKKRQQFEAARPLISFFQAAREDISFDALQGQFFIQGRLLESGRAFWLESGSPVLEKRPLAEWEWSSCFFSADLGDYEEIIPLHFVSLRNLLLPWAGGNLLSVFRRSGEWEVWFRRPARAVVESFEKEIKEHLEAFFKGGVFSPMSKTGRRGPLVYGPESLAAEPPALNGRIYACGLNDFFQNDFAAGLQAEKELFNNYFQKNEL